MSWIIYIIGLIFYGIGGGMIGHIIDELDQEAFGKHFLRGIIIILCFIIGGELTNIAW
jgi:hypothetical protein